MKATVLRALFLWLVLFILLQPMMTYVDYLLDLQIKANTAYLTQKTAVEGRVTPALRSEVVANLTAVGFTASSIDITSASEAVMERSQRLDVYLSAPRVRLFPYWFTDASQPERYYGHGSIMSEYLD